MQHGRRITNESTLDHIHELGTQILFQQQAAFIRAEANDVYNRLKSIAEDAAFVRRASEAYLGLSVVPNLRCGLWYCDAGDDIPPVYFKSTDGHTGVWNFNLRRPNLHILPLIDHAGGVLLVDSTRRGKVMPDALSKTVPIWCAVINVALGFEPPSEAESWLFTPPTAVSRSEHDQIAQRIRGWADLLLASAFTLPPLRLPLRPFWITPTSHFPDLPSQDRSFHPILCVSASKVVPPSSGVERRAGYSYVQGAGDDHEAWSQGLTPQLYWAHALEFQHCTRSDLPELIQTIVQHRPPLSSQEPPSPVLAVHSLISVGRYPVPPASAGFTVILELPFTTTSEEAKTENEKELRLTLEPGKRGQHDFLMNILPAAMAHIASALRAGETVCIACPTGSDASVGVALAALQSFFTNSGELSLPHNPDLVSKASLARCLQWILQARPAANPSRATLKRVNEFFMSPPRAK